MAPRRGAKPVNPNNNNLKNLAITDVSCPICRSILIEPVTLPCSHGFCFTCFDNTMQNTNLACPLCRTRIGSWLRTSRKQNKLINQSLWSAIKDQFPKQVQNKLNGIEDSPQKETIIQPLAEPGAIREEYELEKKKLENELRKKQEAEEKSSKALIKKLVEEEEYKKTVLEEKVKLDEAIAKKLAKQMEAPSTSKSTITSFLSKMNGNNFDSKEYTCRVLCLEKNVKRKNNVYINSLSAGNLPAVKKKLSLLQKVLEVEVSSDSSDCIETECRYFKPIDYRHNPPSEGKSPIKVVPKKPVLKIQTKILSPSGKVYFQSSPLQSAFARSSVAVWFQTKAAKRHGDISLEEKLSKKPKLEEKPVTRTKRQLFNNNQNCDSPPFHGFVNLKKDNARKLQEKADLEFAKKLQDEFNRADRIYSTRSTRYPRASKRQVTLDEICAKTYTVK